MTDMEICNSKKDLELPPEVYEYEQARFSLPMELSFTMPYRYEIQRDRSDEVATGPQMNRVTTMHFHDCFEFVYVDSGTVDAIIGGEYCTVRAGQMMALSSFVPHSIKSAEGAETWLAVIPRSKIPNIDQLMGGRTFCRTVVDDEDGVLLGFLRLLNQINHQHGSLKNLDEQAKQELLATTALSLIRVTAAFSGTRENKSSSALMVQAIEYINLHFREELRVSDLTRGLYCNQNLLSTQFKQTFGMSIGSYINRLRASEVSRLLSERPDITLKEAAERSGFGSLRTLHRVYLKEFGSTPRGSEDAEADAGK